MRLAEDVIWSERDFIDYKLSEDGFCNTCKEFHYDCFCKAFWVRRSAYFSKVFEDITQENRELKQIVWGIENAAMRSADSSSSEVLKEILQILFNRRSSGQ